MLYTGSEIIATAWYLIEKDPAQTGLFLSFCPHPINMNKNIATLLLIAAMLTSCSPADVSLPETSTPNETITLTETAPALPPSETPSPRPGATSTETPFPSKTPPPAQTSTPEITATYAILRGKVNVEKVSCRYGPGAMYLYLYGMVQGATQDIIGRNESGSWVLTKSRGDTISCWVKVDLLDINGDTTTIPIIHADEYNLPKSPFYGPLTNVTAKRTENEVIISWSPLILRAGDDSLQTPYVLQIWVCRGGQIVMESVGAAYPSATIIDESGCIEASHGRVTAAEKHGYTKYAEIPWP